MNSKPDETMEALLKKERDINERLSSACYLKKRDEGEVEKHKREIDRLEKELLVLENKKKALLETHEPATTAAD